MRIATVIGARPQFIKAATVSRIIATTDGINEVLIHTGQHFDANMSDVFFEELGISPPTHHLGIAGGPHGEMTGRMLVAIEEILSSERPDCVLVYGDTNSTLAAAVAAAKLGVPVAHVEAGLRSFNRRMPEEINRIVADRVSRWLMTPTDKATENLRIEGASDDRIRQVGDVMYDAALYYGDEAERSSTVLDQLGLSRRGYILATIHRQENTDAPGRLLAIFEALRTIATDLPVVIPIHPRTRKRLVNLGEQTLTAGLTLIPPVGYLDMVMLERGAAVVATDSGGMQKEAYFHGVPCVTLRDETEWTELLDLGWNRLAPPGGANIVGTIRAAMHTLGSTGQPYGTGDAAEKVVHVLIGG
jgi:UDP-GlcNAc3NAcA epimerase